MAGWILCINGLGSVHFGLSLPYKTEPKEGKYGYILTGVLKMACFFPRTFWTAKKELQEMSWYDPYKYNAL